MQYLIVRTVRVSVRQQGQDPIIQSDGTVENVVVETNNIADAIAYGMLGKVMDGGDSMLLTQFTVLNVIQIDGATREDGQKINALAQGGGGLAQVDRDAWDNMGKPAVAPVAS